MNPKDIEWAMGGIRGNTLMGRVDGILLFTIDYGITRVADGKPYVLYNKIPGYKERLAVKDHEDGKQVAAGILQRFYGRVTS